jgi:RNA polymerase-binding protein DksA
VKSEDLDLEKLEQKLKEQRAVLLSRLQVKGDSDLADTANPDRADLAQDYFSQDRQTALYDRMEGTLEQIEGALERIEMGVYGKCERCGKDISSARLEALPYAELCIECQEEQEKRG